MALRMRAIVVTLVASLVMAAAPEASAASYNRTVDLTFPTNPAVTYRNTYHAGRSGGRTHKASDLMGQRGWKLYAAVSGEICYAPGSAGGYEPSYGYMIRLCGDDGRAYRYLHLNNDNPGTDDGRGGAAAAFAPGIREGVRVERGQHIGYLGDSGNAERTAPHLHFEIEDPNVVDPYGTHRVNPHYSLKAAEQRGDYAAETGVRRRQTQQATSRGATRGEPKGADIERVAGADRVRTSVALSQESFDSAEHVVIAPAMSFPQSAAAGPLAAVRGGPVLSTYGGELDSSVAEEIERLGANSTTLVGSPSILSEKVANELVSQTTLSADSVERIAGDTAAATAAAVAEHVWATTGGDEALLALGSHRNAEKAWPDALASSYLGSVTDKPVLFAAPDELPAPTTEALRGVSEVTVVGGPAAVSESVAAEAEQAADSVERAAGESRYGTALAIAERAQAAGASPARLWAATGREFADALTAGPAVAAAGDVMALVDGLDGDGDEAAVDPWLESRADEIETGVVIGGGHVIGSDARGELSTQLAE